MVSNSLKMIVIFLIVVFVIKLLLRPIWDWQVCHILERGFSFGKRDVDALLAISSCSVFMVLLQKCIQFLQIPSYFVLTSLVIPTTGSQTIVSTFVQFGEIIITPHPTTVRPQNIQHNDKFLRKLFFNCDFICRTLCSPPPQ